MTSHTGQQIITIHILLNISRSKGNQAMTLDQLMKYIARNICLQKSCENEKGGWFRTFFCFLKRISKISFVYFLQKGLRIASPPHFMYDFSRKIFLMLLVQYIIFKYQNLGETKIKLLRQIYLFTATFRVQLHPFSSRSTFSVNPQKSGSLLT